VFEWKRKKEDIYLQPVGTLGDGGATCFAQLCEIGREDGRRDDGRRRHVEDCRNVQTGKQQYA